LEQPSQNILCSQIRRTRSQQALSQELLAARCAVAGWDVSRGTLAKVEAGIRCVTDLEAATLALALRVPLSSLYPEPLAARLRRLEKADC
jgi:transcriptional regulator with XRE-family HTH domain